MQVAAIVVYIICGLFSSNFVTNYVIVVVLLMLDFWTVGISSALHVKGVSSWGSAPCPRFISLVRAAGRS